MGLDLHEKKILKLMSDIDPDNLGLANYSDLKQRIIDEELQRMKGEDESELLDAFVAMGGDEDGSGCVDANKLIDIMKNEFHLTIDIEALIEEIDADGSGEIEFDEFKELIN